MYSFNKGSIFSQKRSVFSFVSFKRGLPPVSEFSTVRLPCSLHFRSLWSRWEKLNIVFPVHSAVCGVLISFSNTLQIKPINPLTFTEFRSFCVNCFERIIDSFAIRKFLASLPKTVEPGKGLERILVLSCHPLPWLQDTRVTSKL